MVYFISQVLVHSMVLAALLWAWSKFQQRKLQKKMLGMTGGRVLLMQRMLQNITPSIPIESLSDRDGLKLELIPKIGELTLSLSPDQADLLLEIYSKSKYSREDGTLFFDCAEQKALREEKEEEIKMANCIYWVSQGWDVEPHEV